MIPLHLTLILGGLLLVSSLVVLALGKKLLRHRPAYRALGQATIAGTLLWIIVSGVTWAAQSRIPTPESLTAFIQKNPLDQAASREAIIDTVAKDYLQLDFLKKRELLSLESQPWEVFKRQLTEEEKRQLVKKLVPEDIKTMLSAFQKKTDAERMKQWERAKRQILENVSSPQVKAFFQQDPAVVNELLKQNLLNLLDFLPPDQSLQAIHALEQWQNDARALRD